MTPRDHTPLSLTEFIALHTYGKRCVVVPDLPIDRIAFVPACHVERGNELDYAGYLAAHAAIAQAEGRSAASEMLAALRWLTKAVATYQCLTTSPRFQQMKVIDALAELADNDCMHSEADLGQLLEKARAIITKVEGRS